MIESTDSLVLGHLRHIRRGVDELRLDVANRRFFLKYKPANATNRSAVLSTIGSMMRSSERTFRRAYRPGSAVVTGPKRNLWAGRSRGSLSPAELAEVNRLITRLIEIMRSGRHDRGSSKREARSLYELTFVLAPAFRRIARS